MVDFLAEAIKVASRSTNKKHKTGCVIVFDNAIIDKGWSHTGEWSLNGLYSIHAEIHALIRAKKKGNLRGCSAYIATVSSKSNAITNAAPCVGCATALLGYGIERVVYTLGTDHRGSMYLPLAITTEKLKEYRRRND